MKGIKSTKEHFQAAKLKCTTQTVLDSGKQSLSLQLVQIWLIFGNIGT